MILISNKIIAQDFIRIENGRFYQGLKEFSFLGFNAYYLQSETAKGNAFIADDVIETARENGFGVIRTWAFNDNDDEKYPGVIQTAPGLYSEAGLKALDYVVFKAKSNGIKLILTLSNNYKDFGGVPQYVRWAEKYLPGKYSHSDFFTLDSIKSWYKHYIHMLLNRTNTYTGVRYKDEPAIFAFELMNEAENAGKPYRVLLSWYNQMSAYMKDIDKNHLLATGEAGYDSFKDQYSGSDLFYNGSDFLFNGYKGTSYFYDTRLDNIDFASYHLYPTGYGFSPQAGTTWIKEHEGIALAAAKPALLGEFGARDEKEKSYRMWLNEIMKTSHRSAIVWQYIHPRLGYNDGFGFNESNSGLFSLFTSYIGKLKDSTWAPPPVAVTESELYQNYPNPFNPVTHIKYSLAEDCYIIFELFNTLGERVALLDEGQKSKGVYEVTLSFEDKLLGSGVYIYSLRAGTQFFSRKMILMK